MTTMRGGFTIIEMLVVIGILALLMGMTIGGIAAMRKTDKLLATEHLVGDVIRQARHTARTSGAPVLVSIRADSDGHGWVSGISRVPIWTEGFDGAPGSLWTCNPPITGVAGKGYKVSMPGSPPPKHALTRGTKLVRGGAADGFYLTCQVRPPLASISGGAVVIPLLVVGPDASGGPEASEATSLCGLMLRRVVRQEQELNGTFAPTTQQNTIAPFPTMPQLATWEILGWVSDTFPSGRLEVSSIDPADRPVDLLRDEPVLHASVPTEYDIAWPMAGGRWEEVGLLFDGEGRRLVLYRNGVRVGERQLAAVPALTDADETVWVGLLDRVPGGAFYADSAIIDEVGVHRLAAADPRRLPGDVKPAQTYRIVAQPDGRVEVDYTAAAAAAAPAAGTAFVAPPTVLVFSGSFNQAATAELTVTIDGRVSGRIAP